MQNIKKNATNAHAVTGVAFLNLPPIVNTLGVSRITSRVSLKILVSLIVFTSIFTPINSTNVYYLYFFLEQDRRNDLLSNVTALSLKMIDTSLIVLRQ